MDLYKNREKLAFPRMKHAGKLKFGQVGEIICTFRCMTPDF